MGELLRRIVRKLQRVAVGGGPTGLLGVGLGTPEPPEAWFRPTGPPGVGLGTLELPEASVRTE